MEDVEAIRHHLSKMENPVKAISEYADLLVLLTTSSDAESVTAGIHRLLYEIKDHAGEVVMQWENLWARAADMQPNATSSLAAE